jgi:hypothetical protein
MEIIKNNAQHEIAWFCQSFISRYREMWPPTEELLAEEFVNRFCLEPFQTREALIQLCLAKGVNLSFSKLPNDLHGFNCSYQETREIMVSEDAKAPFADLHTILHEFREMLEGTFTSLDFPTIRHEQSLEVRAEHFAMACRMQAVQKELPRVFQTISDFEKTWVRYFAYSAVGFTVFAYLLSCVFMRQIEHIDTEIKRQRYVRM